jgi:hypothetical protein|tara:strand:+ start:1500 stop:1808 length:309 start_codon:yes stop_codon:yes gene_type:complete
MKYAFKLLSLMLFPSLGFAAAPDLASAAGGGGFFGGLIDFMQTWVDFIAGPWALLVVFIGLVAVLFLWILAPKAGEVIGAAIRVVVAGFVLFNIGALLSSFS